MYMYIYVIKVGKNYEDTFGITYSLPIITSLYSKNSREAHDGVLGVLSCFHTNGWWLGYEPNC